MYQSNFQMFSVHKNKQQLTPKARYEKKKLSSFYSTTSFCRRGVLLEKTDFDAALLVAVSLSLAKTV